jgi:ribosomal protein S18 acetylase RimI-like enzyme
MSPPIELLSWWSLSSSQREAVLALQVSPIQIEYAGPIERAVASIGDSASENLAGIAVLRAEEVVGFLVLKRNDKAPTWAGPGMAVVSALRVDQRCQGGGIGSQALLSLESWVHAYWPESTVIALSVDEENSRGIAAYVRAGFIDWGKREQGRIGWVRYMSKPVRIQPCA